MNMHVLEFFLKGTRKWIGEQNNLELIIDSVEPIFRSK
jgi:hypothetical protein